MIPFLVFFFSIYGFMHLVFYGRIRCLLPRSGWFDVLFLLALLPALAAPVLTRVLERGGHAAMARSLGWVSYTWMGFVFLAFWLSALMWGCDLVIYGVNRFTPWHLMSLRTPVPALILIVIAVVLCLVAFHEMRHVRLERVRIETAKCPKVGNPFKVIQISDLHLGLMHELERTREVIAAIRAEKPDLVVSTGDLVDGDFQDGARLAELFRELRAPFGCYAVTGNHEAYAGVARSVAWTRRAGFAVLRDQTVTVPGVIHIAGVDDPVINGNSDAEVGLLPERRKRLFTLLLKHRPVVSSDCLGRFDLQLSGHTHRGQIFPFSFVVKLVYPWLEGLHQVAAGSWLYVSRGTGAWGPQMRLLAPPEITVIELVAAK